MDDLRTVASGREREPSVGRERLQVVLIVGSSYSGSTLLGLLIGSGPGTVYMGELNQIRRLWNPPEGLEPAYRLCTCGVEYGDCPFWRGVLARYGSRTDLNPAPGFSLRNLRLLIRILLRRPPRREDDLRLLRGHRAVIEAIAGTIREEGWLLEASRVVDSSKSLQSLEALATARELDLRVVHLLREARGIMASARGRGRSVWGALAGWGVVHGALHFYLNRQAAVPVLRVDYRRLCEDPRGELRRVGRFLDLDLDPDRAAASIRGARHHILGGSKSVRPTLARFEGVEWRDGSSRLRPLERSAADVCTRLVRRLCRFSPAPPIRRPAGPAGAG